jgi:hypothetical protein
VVVGTNTKEIFYLFFACSLQEKMNIGGNIAM